MKIIFLILVSILFSCSNQEQKINEYYYEATYQGEIVSYEKRIYKYEDDRLVESIFSYKTNGELIQTKRRNYRVVDGGLDIIINQIEHPFLRNTENEYCHKYEDPLVNEVEVCFIKSTNMNSHLSTIEYSYNELITDGLFSNVIIDNEFALITKKISGLGSFDELGRVEKNQLPNIIQEKL